MTVEQIVEDLKHTAGCKCYEPLPMDLLQAQEDKLGLRFPTEYRRFLELTNGCEVYYGHYRIFGFDPNRSIDARRWNQNDYWKFAWSGAADDYWCFGETAFGDQYAFAVGELSRAEDVPVYQLHHGSMATGSPWDESFLAFLENEFLRNARSPYSARERRAYEILGPLRLDQHVALVPPLLLLPTGDDGMNSQLQVMPSRAAMVCNGDLCVQWDAGCEQHKQVNRVEPCVDNNDLMRLRIIWAD